MTYSAVLHGTASINSTELESLIEEWIAEGASVNVQRKGYNFSSAEEECYKDIVTDHVTTLSVTSSTKDDTNNNKFIIIIGSTSAGIVLIITVIVMLTIGALARKRRKSQQGIR